MRSIRRGGDCPRSVLVQREQWPIVVYVLGVKDGHRSIVQDQPALFVANRDDSVPRFALFILHDDETEIVSGNSKSAKRDIFDDCIVFAVACSAAQRLQGRSPEVGKAILHPIAHRPYCHVDCAIDPSKAHTTVALGAKVNDRKKLARSRMYTRPDRRGRPSPPPRRQECATAIRSISRRCPPRSFLVELYRLPNASCFALATPYGKLRPAVARKNRPIYCLA